MINTRAISRKTYGRRNRMRSKIGKNEIIFLIVLFSLFLGAIVGVIRCNSIDSYQYDSLSEHLHLFFNDIRNINTSHADIFFESVIKYGKILLIIWFMAFLPPASAVAIILIFIKGMSGSFTTTFLIREFGIRGLYYAFILYLPQNLILIPTYIYASYSSLNFTFLQISRNRANHEKPNSRRYNKLSLSNIFLPSAELEKKSFMEYVTVLLIGCCCIITVGLIETYIIPYFISSL